VRRKALRPYLLGGKHWGKSHDLLAAITGFANFVAMVNPHKGTEFKKQVQRIEQKYKCTQYQK
jgi:RNA-directed DNA polymerase